MKKSLFVLILICSLTLSSCASYNPIEVMSSPNPIETPSEVTTGVDIDRVNKRIEVILDYRSEPAGFWKGLVHGILAPFAFIGIMFGNETIGIYETYNNGNWYNFGFLIGCGAIWFDSGITKKKKKDDDD